MFALFLVAFPVMSVAETFVSVAIAPPALPIYVQPAVPGPGYLWTPGYWAYGPAGYFWVPGTWVLPPAVGLLWTPGYWGWGGGAYLWHAGYWGPRVGYYGGVNYGFGYVGTGYHGGYWRNNAFYYNRAVNNVTGIHTTYNATVNTTTINRVSYNGGPGGIRAEPTPIERQAMNERHVEATQMQLQHQNAAAENRAMFASENHGRPAIAATPQPGAFNRPGVTSANEIPAGTGPKTGRYKSGTDGTQSLSTQQARPQGGARNQANVQGSAQGATASRDKPHRQASGATNPQEANVAGARAQSGQPHSQAHTQGGTPGGAQGAASGHPQKAREASEPHGEGQRH